MIRNCFAQSSICQREIVVTSAIRNNESWMIKSGANARTILFMIAFLQTSAVTLQRQHLHKQKLWMLATEDCCLWEQFALLARVMSKDNAHIAAYRGRSTFSWEQSAHLYCRGRSFSRSPFDLHPVQTDRTQHIFLCSSGRRCCSEYPSDCFMFSSQPTNHFLSSEHWIPLNHALYYPCLGQCTTKTSPTVYWTQRLLWLWRESFPFDQRSQLNKAANVKFVWDLTNTLGDPKLCGFSSMAWRTSWKDMVFPLT